MLKERGTDYVYREYKEDILSAEELRVVFDKLGMTPQRLLRGGDARTFGLKGDESADELIDLMAIHPTLLQRPILMNDSKAVLGRPVENILELL